jgi:hypothetical protein
MKWSLRIGASVLLLQKPENTAGIKTGVKTLSNQQRPWQKYSKMIFAD